MPNVIDVRAIGLVAGVELSSRPDAPASRAFDVMVDCFNRGLVLRVTGDTLAMSPPLIVERSHIDDMAAILGDAIKRVA
jgi:beta-alanine--pyruvate transaminase